ncbi:S8 family serine peptidase [Pediococcus pentosaceus]|uniref:S8 family serine peptidase n=2 Tax=Pediococcus pentosaceus TaxID=1255 RepID=UPI001326B819|nr:S8 family serine peptidase [Pediococcus pentosaceus]KAF0500644.1 S8 family serine peptidase [Pediococcus pentosaceus]MBF7136904.1 S8 family serine peptidase [Pediococcus pentosaceus]
MRRNSMTEMKRHYKLYKSGSKWVAAAIITVSAGAILLSGNATQSVSADTTAAATVQTQTDTETTGQSSTAGDDAQNAADNHTQSSTATEEDTTPAQSSATASQATSATTTSQSQAGSSAATSGATATSGASASSSSAATTTTPAATTSGASASSSSAATTTTPTATTSGASASSSSAATTTTPTVTTSGASASSSSAATTTTPAATTTAQATADATADPGPANQDTLTKGNVEGLWNEGYQGQGMVVAVIDSGVQPHADLRLTDDSTAAISKDAAEAAIAKLGYGTYVNSKIPFAYDYVNNDSVNTGTTVSGSTHGEHVAGIIAANGTVADGATGTSKASVYVKGVAPEAQILAMQVIDEFPDENANDISRAIRDAVSMGANAIQMSLGIGVAEQDLTDEEQAAVQYATDHGVFVSISASNDANAASIVGSDTPNDISTAYVPKNDSTIADPGAAASAMTVAAEKSATGADSEMDGFSSWGPMADYTLKPDIAAPGDSVTSTAIDPTTNTQTYAVESGTSMAGPYDAGAALLVMQKLKATRPELQGADLVKAVKLALMNAADPMIDLNYPDNYVSPRRQGAGQIDVTKAGNLDVAAEGTNNAGSVSLGKIGQTTSFNVTLTNYGQTTQSYTVDYDGGPLTQVWDTIKGNIVHDQKLAGAAVNSATPTFTLAPGASKVVTFTLALADAVAANQIVEGYLTFKAGDDTQTISVPYLGYFGDLTTEQIIDDSANKQGSIFKGGYLVDNNNNPLGVTDAASLSNLVNSDVTGKYTWGQVPAYIENGKVSFSPNGDGSSDTVYPYVFAKQNLKAVTIQILDANGNLVRVLDKENNTTKSYLQDGSSHNSDLGLSTDMRLDADAFTWDGRIYDQQTGKYITAPDGRYTYRIVTEQYNDGAEQEQNFDLPVSVDTVAPTLTGLTYAKGQLTASYNDRGAGFSQFSDAVLKIGAQEYGVSLDNNGQSNAGTISFKLTAAQMAALATSDGQLTLTVTDVAGNHISASVQAFAGTTSTSATDTAANVAPQFSWQVGDGSNNHWRTEGFVQAVSDQTSFTAYAQVPAGVDWIVYATDAIAGKVFPGKVDTATGIVTFNLTEGAPYGDFVGTVLYPTANFGEYKRAGRADGDEMIVFLDADGTAGYGHFSTTNPHTVIALRDNADAAEDATVTTGAPVLSGRAFADITTHAQPTAGLSFDKFNDNTFTLVGADQVADVYDPQTGELTITGKVADPAGKAMTVTDATEPTKAVAINADGTFSFTVPFKAAEQQSVGYRLTTTTNNDDGTTASSTAYGELQIYLDTVFPTLSMPQANTLTVDADGNYDITTSDPTFTVTGTVNDNVNGYRLYTNGDNVVHQKNLAGFNNHVDADAASSNPYGAADFSQTYNLLEGDNYFTVTAVDMVGNTITKVFHVIRVGATSVTPKSQGSKGTAITSPVVDGGQRGQAQGAPDVHPAAPGYKNDGQGGVQLVPAASQAGRPQSGAEQGQSPATTTAAAMPATGDTHSPLAAITSPVVDGGQRGQAQGAPDVHPAAPGYKNDGQGGVQLVPAASQVGRPQSGAGQGQSPATTTAAAMPATGDTHSPLAAIGLAILSVLGLAGLVSRKRRV